MVELAWQELLMYGFVTSFGGAFAAEIAKAVIVEAKKWHHRGMERLKERERPIQTSLA